MGDAGKLGLALSGGGFRASFFHLGVLARLAEEGLLRQVEVISTVSGGSIIGAAYYVRLRRLLNAKADPTDSDYEDVVADVDRVFRAAVGRNIRAQILANPLKNVRMLLPAAPGANAYSRTDRIGELCDRHIYRPLMGEPGRSRPVELRELKITPPGEDDSFNPTSENAGREVKVPILIVNATTLNTGHGWRFEVVCMGENVADRADPADDTLRDVDKNRELQRGYFGGRDEPEHRLLPEALRCFPLGHAVAASAAVPGIFHPLAISEMYRGVRVRLVDGGVHDNQGVGVLVDSGCARMIISDASAQMADLAKPKPWAPFVAGRSLSIFSDRVREQQLTLVKPNVEPDMRLIHLRKGLAEQTVEVEQSWESDRLEGETNFGVSREMQEYLAHIRTDLDTFSEIESASLACDAYLITGDVLGADRGRFGLPAEAPGLWSSQPARSLRRAAEPLKGDDRFAKHLDVGRLRFFREIGLLTSRSVARRVPVGLGVAAAGGGVRLALRPGWMRVSLAEWLKRGGIAFASAVLGASVWSWLVASFDRLLERAGRLPDEPPPSSK